MLPSLALILFAASLSGHAQDFSVRTRTVHELEMGNFDTLEIQSRGGQFTLLPPRSWRTETDTSSGTIRFYAPRGKAILTVQFSPDVAINSLDSGESILRQAAPQLLSTRVLEAFPAHGGDRKGKGIDFAFLLQGSLKQGRAAVLGLNRGCVSLLLTCTKDDFKDYEQTFASVLRSFQSVEKLTAQK